jgi:hypothetical protein
MLRDAKTGEDLGSSYVVKHLHELPLIGHRSITTQGIAVRRVPQKNKETYSVPHNDGELVVVTYDCEVIA